MAFTIQQTILFLILLIFPVKIHSKNHCPDSFCGTKIFPVRYPFKLPTDHTPKTCRDFINLTCNNQGQGGALINLPSSGNLNAIYIDYDTRKITLSDPGNCLPRKLMRNISLYPLRAFRYESYTYFFCPRKRVRDQFSVIECLSSVTNATIAVTGFSARFMEEVYGCQAIGSALIPAEYEFSGILDEIQLTWDADGCRECEDDGIDGKSGDSRSKWSKFVRSPLFIPSAVVLVTFFGLAFVFRLIRLTAARSATTNNTTPENTSTANSSATAAPPLTTVVPPTAPPGTAGGPPGIEINISKINGPSGGTCSICLEEYDDRDRVSYLSQCGHYFHVECIDLWIPKSTTCPVCRTQL